MSKFTVEITQDQKNLIDNLKNDETNQMFFNKLLASYGQLKKSYLTIHQSEYLQNLGGLSIDDHIHLAIDSYIQRLRDRAKRVKATGKVSKSEHAMANVVKLIESIMADNRAAKSPLEMVFINLSVLKKKSNGSINQRVLQRALYLMQDQLALHHEKLGIGINHNRHRRLDG